MNVEALLDLSETDPQQCLKICFDTMNEKLEEHDTALVRLCAGLSYMNIALKELPTDAEEMPSETALKCSQGALVHLKAALGLSAEISAAFLQDSNNTKAIDRVCAALEKAYPGCISKHQLWDTIKLKYFGSRIWFHPLKENEAKDILDVPFSPPDTVLSAFVAAGGTTDDKQEMLYVLLFDYENPWDESSNKLKDWKKEVYFVKDSSGVWIYRND